MKEVRRIDIEPSSIVIERGKWYYGLSASVTPEDATDKTLHWSSSNTNVASVNQSSGAIYGVGIGTSTISAISTNGKSDSVTISVVETVTATDMFFGRDKYVINTSERFQLPLTLIPENTSKNALSWSSSNSCVATVVNGEIVGVSVGTAIITVTALGNTSLQRTCEIKVTNDVLVKSVQLSIASETLAIGDYLELEASVSPSNSTNKNVIWSSNNEDVALVNANTGMVTIIGEGYASIYAHSADGSGAYDFCNITAIKDITVNYLKVFPKNLTLSPSETARVEYNIDVCPIFSFRTREVTWRSSDENIATVSRYMGEVTAIKKGKVNIIARSEYDKSVEGVCRLTVDNRDIVYINFDPDDSDFIIISFSNGHIWKCIIQDLEEVMDENLKDTFIDRHNQNMNIKFSLEELSFLYLIDPIWVAEYVKQCSRIQGFTLLELLYFKDNLYQLIFGRIPEYFIVNSDDTISYYKDINYAITHREDCYSTAETLFGYHLIITPESCIKIAHDVIVGILKMVPWPPLQTTFASIQLIKLFFFSGSITELNPSATNFMKTYSGAEDLWGSPLQAGDNVFNMFKWASGLLVALDFVESVTNTLSEEIRIPNQNDITIYNKINTSNYKLIFNKNGHEISLEDILSHLERFN